MVMHAGSAKARKIRENERARLANIKHKSCKTCAFFGKPLSISALGKAMHACNICPNTRILPTSVCSQWTKQGDITDGQKQSVAMRQLHELKAIYGTNRALSDDVKIPNRALSDLLSGRYDVTPPNQRKIARLAKKKGLA